MSKFSKKITAILLSIIFILTPLSVHAAETTLDNSSTDENLRILVDKEIKEISYDEFVEVSAKANNLSKSEFIISDSKNLTRSSSYVYKQITYTYSYSANSAFAFSIVAVFRLEGYGNYYDIVSCSAVYTKPASGTGTYTWVEGAAGCESLSASQATILGSGYFQVIKSDSTSISGVNLSHSIGNNYYFNSDSITKVQTVTIEELKSAPAA